MRLLTTALVAIAALSGAASASEATTKSVVISFSASELSEVQGLNTLRARINTAAIRVCDLRTSRSLQERAEARRCVAEARANAEAQLTTAVARVNGAVEVTATVR